MFFNLFLKIRKNNKTRNKNETKWALKDSNIYLENQGLISKFVREPSAIFLVITSEFGRDLGRTQNSLSIMQYLCLKIFLKMTTSYLSKKLQIKNTKQ